MAFSLTKLNLLKKKVEQDILDLQQKVIETTVRLQGANTHKLIKQFSIVSLNLQLLRSKEKISTINSLIQSKTT